MDWKFTGDRPVYQQIMEQIRGSILKGALPPGERIASVRDLAAQAQVNPNTVQRALEDLARECAEKFMVFGVGPAQAAELLRGLEKEEE